MRGNMAEEWDFAHGCNLDVLGTAKDLGKFAFTLCVMVVCNFHHSPERDPQMRRAQSSEARTWFSAASTTPLLVCSRITFPTWQSR